MFIMRTSYLSQSCVLNNIQFLTKLRLAEQRLQRRQRCLKRTKQTMFYLYNVSTFLGSVNILNSNASKVFELLKQAEEKRVARIKMLDMTLQHVYVVVAAEEARKRKLILFDQQKEKDKKGKKKELTPNVPVLTTAEPTQDDINSCCLINNNVLW